MKVDADMKIVEKGNLFAIGKVTLNDMIVLEQVKVINVLEGGENRYFISMPQRKNGDKWEPICRITSPEIRKEIEDEIYRAVKKAVEKEFYFTDMERLIIEVTPVNKGNTRAFVTLTMDGAIELKQIRVMNGEKGLFVAYPSMETNGNYSNLFHAPSQYIMQQIQNEILDAYQKKIGEKQETIDTPRNKGRQTVSK